MAEAYRILGNATLANTAEGRRRPELPSHRANKPAGFPAEVGGEFTALPPPPVISPPTLTMTPSFPASSPSHARRRHSRRQRPATYIAFAKEFQTLANQIDPTISIGLDSVSKNNYVGWLNSILTQSVSRISARLYFGHLPRDAGYRVILPCLATPRRPNPVSPAQTTPSTLTSYNCAAVYRSLFTIISRLEQFPRQYVGYAPPNTTPFTRHPTPAIREHRQRPEHRRLRNRCWIPKPACIN